MHDPDVPGATPADTDARAAEDRRLAALRAELVDVDRGISALQGRRVRVLAEICEIAQGRTARLSPGNSPLREMALRSIALEFAAAARVPDSTMQRHIGDAEQLVRLFPAATEALSAGTITRAHADAIADAGCAIVDGRARAAYEEVALRFAATTTAARTRAYARQLAERLNPRSIDERFADAEERRLVTVTEIEDGMAQLTAILPAAIAFGIKDRLDRMEKALREDDTEHVDAGQETWTDERTRDQRRADLFADLLLTGSPVIDPLSGAGIPGGLGAIRGHVQITVPVTTLTGVTSGGAELDGRAPVDTQTARRLAGDAPGWDRVLTDPVTGTVLEVDRYSPLESQRRFLRARDIRCRCPGCRRPARDSQIDHTHERHDGGPTRLDNLAHLCVRHHTLKTETEWSVTQGTGGSLIWTSPLGFDYRDDPPTRVVFAPDDDPPPF